MNDMNNEVEARGGPRKSRRLAGESMMSLKPSLSSQEALLPAWTGKVVPGGQLPHWAVGIRRVSDGARAGYHAVVDWFFANRYEQEDAFPGEGCRSFGRELAAQLGVNPDYVSFGYERRTLLHVEGTPLADERRHAQFEAQGAKQERERIARIFEQGITAPVGCVLPLRKLWWLAQPVRESGTWVVRSDEMFLTPGDSAMGFRLPLQSLMWYSGIKQELFGYARDPMETRTALPEHDRLREELFARSAAWAHKRQPVLVGGGSERRRQRSARRCGSLCGRQRHVARSVCRSARLCAAGGRRSVERGPDRAMHRTKRRRDTRLHAADGPAGRLPWNW